MDNQHKKIKGYRDLSQQEIDSINAIKEMGGHLKNVISELRVLPDPQVKDDIYPDQWWVSVGETHLQQGIMALVRSVAKPEGF